MLVLELCDSWTHVILCRYPYRPRTSLSSSPTTEPRSRHHDTTVLCKPSRPPRTQVLIYQSVNLELALRCTQPFLKSRYQFRSNPVVWSLLKHHGCAVCRKCHRRLLPVIYQWSRNHEQDSEVEQHYPKMRKKSSAFIFTGMTNAI